MRVNHQHETNNLASNSGLFGCALSAQNCAPISPEKNAKLQLGEKGCETNGFNYFDKIAFWKTPIAEGGKFVPYSRWTQDYIAIMGGR